MTGGAWTPLVPHALLILGGLAIFLVIQAAGGALRAPGAPGGFRPVGAPAVGQVDLILHVTVTLAAVVAAGALLSRLMGRVGQPAVIGEVAAGILLGPSLLGWVAPDLAHLLIPGPDVDPKGQVPAALKAISELGVILYMFLVGLELDLDHLAERAQAALVISNASIVAPFVLGAVLALGLYPVFSHDGVPFTSFALFLGSAMAITAFPVLARLLTDRGMEKTELGALALGCAALNDVTAWCLLALVVGFAQADLSTSVRVVAGAIAFIALMLVVARPLVRNRVARIEAESAALPQSVVSGIFLAILLSALATQIIGIHAVFGAFLFGALIPHESRVCREFTARLKDPVTVLLLPAFFTYTGLRTQIGLVSGWENWLWCLLICVVATVGKFGGTFAAAWYAGLAPRAAAALGALMNTRGLMELIVLNIGLDLGVISPTLFAMMVVMALVTTALTVPALNSISGTPSYAAGHR